MTAAVAPPWRVQERVEVRPPWPFRLAGRGGLDGIVRRRGAVLERAVWVEDGDDVAHVAVVRMAQPSADRVVIGARATTADVAREALDRSRKALGVDVDLRPFYDRFRDDPWIGSSVRARPHLRPAGRPDPFEVFAFAVCEQLIEYERAAAIERRLLRRFGRRCPSWDGTGTLVTAPAAATVAALSPAELEALDLAAGRAVALVRGAREIVRGRIELTAASGHEAGWRRLRQIPGIGAWTLAVLALHGQGRYDQLPAGDLAYLKLAGQILRPELGPAARATEDEVRELLAPYVEAGWGGLAGLHALGSKASAGGATLRFAA